MNYIKRLVNPIEIPFCLRKEEFLKRKYQIVDAGQVPMEGNYFLKDVTELKRFSYAGRLEHIMHDQVWEKKNGHSAGFISKEELHLDPEHLFQVSEYVDIDAEYRVYCVSGRIEAAVCYNGGPFVLPDMELLRKANLIYSTQSDYPKSLTIDVGVSKERGTFLLEIHPFVSVGLYHTVWGTNLLYAYRDGIDYYARYNTPIYHDQNC